MEDTQEVQRAARILNDGHFYITNAESRRALEAVRAVDPHAATALFERWRDDGHIRPDLDADRRHGIAPRPDQQQEESLRQGHRR